ncbi:ChbG/HpnK family deacetylase [Granulicella arctica]|uniref:ChbG/HpnK family deacetylase n=1 Tax=Granulicella arctica TaxID=940613 RepID=UPI0021E03EBF|nr:ChbG/HpnK family deacetylase [Granulicella arctica]
MPPHLIINADDFGLTPGINRAIAELHCAKVLTSATLMATGPAFEDAASLARSLPTLGIGCHIILVDGTPISPPAEIPTLLGPDRKSFRPTLGHFVRDLFLNRIDPAEIAHEARAQILHLQRAGLTLTHIDTHKHTHIFLKVACALIPLLAERNIHAIRKPFEPTFSIGDAPLKRRLQLALLNRFQPAFTHLASQSRTTNGTLGIAATGTLTESSLQQILQSLPPTGTYELCCHPGYNDPDLSRITTLLRTTRDTERQALQTQIPTLPTTTQLIHYGNLT